jgi:hypothetical protein
MPLRMSALDWGVELGSPAVGLVLLVWSWLRPWPPHRRRRDDDASS